MDIFTMFFYALICALLSLVAPNLPRPAYRLGLGAAVGILAAASLPVVKQSLGI